MFCHITHNWRGKPLTSLDAVVELIGATKTSQGLRIKAVLDTAMYADGIKVSDKQMSALALVRDDFHGDWNYTIEPRPSP